MSTYRSIFAVALCALFEQSVGKWQSRRPVPRAFVVSFATRVGDGEEGYRTLDVVLYGEMNYVQVLTRTHWNVVDVDDLALDDDGEVDGLLPGRSYREGSSAWSEVAYHDSCWRDAVEEILRDHEEEILTLKTDLVSGSFWRTVDPEELRAARRA